MQRKEKSERSQECATRKKLRSTFRAVLAATKMGYETDLTGLSAELSTLQEPDDLKSARHYIKTVLPAAQAHFAQGDLDSSLTLLEQVVSICRKYHLSNQELRVTARIVAILRRRLLWTEAREYIERAIQTAKEAARRPYLMKFEEELAIIDALLAYRKLENTENGRVFFQDAEQTANRQDQFIVKMLEAAEAVGARRARMRRTVFDRKRDLSPRDPRRNGGRRKAVAVSTLLKNECGAWTRPTGRPKDADQ